MKITKLQCVTSLLIVLAIAFLVGVFLNLELLTNYSRALVFPFFIYLYFIESERKNSFFGIFLISCAIAEISKVIWQFDYSAFSKVSNIAYIIGYINLILYIVRSINFKTLFAKFKLPILVLILFNTYLVYALNQMILADNTLEIYTFNFLIECLYNVCILLVLSFSLLNYLYHDSKRGLLLFLASVCIVFSEVVQVAYLFVSAEYTLNIIYSLLLLAGFYLFYVYIVAKINTYYKVLF